LTDTGRLLPREELEIMTIQDTLYDQIVAQGASSETLRILLFRVEKERRAGESSPGVHQSRPDLPPRSIPDQMLAESYADVGFLSQAEKELEKLTGQMDDLIRAYKLQARIFEKQNRREEAIRSLRIYLAHHPEDHEALDVFEALHAPHPAIAIGGRSRPGTGTRGAGARRRSGKDGDLLKRRSFRRLPHPPLLRSTSAKEKSRGSPEYLQKVLARNPQEKTRADALKNSRP
jgi:tetratricopeptide (TPR) repeat protein